MDDEIDGGRIEGGFLEERMRGAGWALLEALVLKSLLRDVRLIVKLQLVRERERRRWSFW